VAEIVAKISELYIYPIKSMAGVSVEEAYVGMDGIFGDRQYAFVRADQAASNSFPWMTARQLTRMILYTPQFEVRPSPQEPEPAITVRTPEKTMLAVNDPALRELLTAESGQPLFLLKCGRGLFDCQHLSLFSLASVRALAEDIGRIDPRQFRANIYIEPTSAEPFAEESWTGGILNVGVEVLAGVTQRDPRCMMINLNPEDAEQNVQVLKTVVKAHQGQAGIYANVIRPGVVRVGDPIRWFRNP
jgi:uncharacterized protein YcbX